MHDRMTRERKQLDETRIVLSDFFTDLIKFSDNQLKVDRKRFLWNNYADGRPTSCRAPSVVELIIITIESTFLCARDTVCHFSLLPFNVSNKNTTFCPYIYCSTLGWDRYEI